MKKTTADETIGAQVRVARQLRRVSLRALSRKIGVSPATLSQIENGRTRLTAVRLGHIAGVLEFEIHQILRMPIDSPNPVGTAHKPSKSLSEVSGTSDWRSYAPLAFDPVLAAALGEFVDIGYHGATVRGIAARCNMSVSGMYHHYPVSNICC
ncbi:TetR family transcriptional regulator [Rhodococcus erythropolis]